MKTIAELNEKWWYRVIQVITVIIVLLWAADITERTAEYYSPQMVLSLEKSNVQCLVGNQSSFSFKELSSTFSKENLAIKDLDPELLAALCEIKDPFGDTIPKGTEIFNFMTEEKADQYLENPEIVKQWEDEIAKSYSVNEIEEMEGSWIGVVWRIVAQILMVLVAVEIIKRTFYYIVLGSIRPKKKHESDTIL